MIAYHPKMYLSVYQIKKIYGLAKIYGPWPGLLAENTRFLVENMQSERKIYGPMLKLYGFFRKNIDLKYTFFRA